MKTHLFEGLLTTTKTYTCIFCSVYCSANVTRWAFNAKVASKESGAAGVKAAQRRDG